MLKFKAKLTGITKKPKLNLLIRLAMGFPMWKQNWRAGLCLVNVVFSANRL